MSGGYEEVTLGDVEEQLQQKHGETMCTIFTHFQKTLSEQPQ